MNPFVEKLLQEAWVFLRPELIALVEAGGHAALHEFQAELQKLIDGLKGPSSPAA